MATDYGKTLLCLTDLPRIGAMVSGPTAAAYRCARRLLQPEGGLLDVIEAEDDVEYPEANYLSVDLREYLGRDMDDQDLAALESKATSAINEEADVESATVDASFTAGELSVTVDAVGAEGPFSFILSVSDVTSATLRVL